MTTVLERLDRLKSDLGRLNRELAALRHDVTRPDVLPVEEPASRLPRPP